MSTVDVSTVDRRGPAWTRHAIFWHAYPLGFAGAPIRAEHGTEVPEPRGLVRLANWLDHVVELGCSGLLLGPVFRSSSHGYDTLDHFAIDPRLGTEDDFDALVRACHERGLRLVLDGVFSHVGSEHPWVGEALEATGPARIAVHTDDDGHRSPEVFEGHGSLPRLNHAEPAVRDDVVAIMDHWLQRGADGWRLDAAYSVPGEFWADVLPRVRQTHPEAWFLGEVIHGDYPAIIEASTMDSLTQYELWKAIWSSLVDENFYELAWALKRHDEFLDTFCPQTFIGNHDVTRIISTVGIDKARLALVVLLTVAGIPSIYHGDELGLTGTKYERLGGDDEIRPQFTARPDDVDAEQRAWIDLHRSLIGLRRRHPWLVTARTSAEELTNTAFTFRVADPADQERWLRVRLAVQPECSAVIDGPEGSVWQL